MTVFFRERPIARQADVLILGAVPILTMFAELHQLCSSRREEAPTKQCKIRNQSEPPHVGCYNCRRASPARLPIPPPAPGKDIKIPPSFRPGQARLPARNARLQSPPASNLISPAAVCRGCDF